MIEQRTSKPRKAEKPKPTPAHTHTLDAFRARIDKIIDLAEAERKAERDALDKRTGGQYSALLELERAFAAVLEIQAGERTFIADTDEAGDQQAHSMELQLLRRPQRVNKARQALVKTGFPVPDQWLTVHVDFAIGQRCSRPSTLLSGERFCDVTLSGRPGEWRLWWNAPPDPAALDRCIREIGAAIMRLDAAPAVSQDAPAAGGNGKGTAPLTEPEAAGSVPHTQSATPTKARLSCPDLAAQFNVPINALYKRLARWRRQHGEGWYDVPNPGRNQPRIVYELQAVMPITQALRNKATPADKRHTDGNPR